MSKPTPDTSPGDELFDINIDPLWLILDDFAEDVEALDEENYNEKLSEAMAEAKDRLNRLMLTRAVSELSTIANLVDSDYSRQAVFDAITARIAAIDAQLNKKETDGDVPTHSEPFKP